MAFVLLSFFGSQQPAKFTAALHHHRHFFAAGINHDIRDWRYRHFRGGTLMHRVKQTPFGFGANRLRFTVGIDVIELIPAASAALSRRLLSIELP